MSAEGLLSGELGGHEKWAMAVALPSTFAGFLERFVDDEAATEFCFEYKLLRVDWFCNGCGQFAVMIADVSMADGVAWRCQGCGRKVSIRCGSFVERSKLGVRLELEIAFLWGENWVEESVSRECDVSVATVSRHFVRFGDACQRWGRSHQMSIGGLNQTVEIDETQLTRKVKIGGRDVVLSDVWVFGGICRESGEIFAEPIPNRSRLTLMAYIAKYVRPGTTIVSDSWKGYGNLEALFNGAYRHIKVDHSHNFVDPITGANTQRIERLWRELKEKKKRMQGIRRWQAQAYVSEFLLRQKWRHEGKTTFHGTLELIRDTDWTQIP